MNIIPNFTLVALQLIPFLVTIASLYYILFKPMMDYLEGRDNASSGATDTAKQLEDSIQAKKQEITEKVQAALKEASEKRSAHRQELVEAYNVFVHDKRKMAEEEIKGAIHDIHIEKAAARQSVLANAESFANDIASKIIGRNIA